MQPISRAVLIAGALLICLCSLNSFAGASATNGVVLVQSGSAEGSSVTSVSKMFVASNTAGNLVLAFVRASTTTQKVTVSDTAGNTYTDAVWQLQNTDGHQIHLFYAANIKGGPNTVTAQFSGTNNHPWLAIYEYSGVSAANPMDKTAAAQGHSAVASSGATATTASANELVFTGLGLPSGSSAVVTVGTSYRMEQQDAITNGSRAATGDQGVSAAGAYTGSFNLSASANWSALVATFAVVTSTPPPSGPTISTASLPSGTQNVTYSAALQASGGTTPYTWSISAGSLPAGLQLNSGTGTISGTPTNACTSNFTVQLADASSNRTAQTLNLTINGAPSPPPSSGGGTSLMQSGAVEGTGVTAVSTAFPGANTAGNLIIVFVRMSTTTQTVTVSDTAGNAYSQAVSQLQSTDGHQLHLFYAPNIKGGANTVNASFSGTNNHPWLAIYEYSGLSTTNPLDKTAAAQGSSSAPSSGATAVTSAANELVFSGLGLPSSSSATVTAGSAYSLLRQDTKSGGSRAATEGATTNTVGAYTGSFSLGASLPWSAVVATFFSATGNPAPLNPVNVSISPATAILQPQATQQFTATVSGNNNTAVTWLVSGVAGGNSAVGTISSTGLYQAPSIVPSGSVMVTAQSVADSTKSASSTVSIVASAPAVTPLALTTSSLPSATVGHSYAANLTASGGTPPYTWTLASGPLPAGLTLSPSGTISGTPTAAGDFTFYPQVTDSAASPQAATGIESLTVDPATSSLSIQVSGNHLVNQNGQTIHLIGFNAQGSEYMCVTSNQTFDNPNTLTTAPADMKSWGAAVNGARIPLNEDCWLGINGVSRGGAAYQNDIIAFVNNLHASGMYAILDLHWNAPGGTKATGEQVMADYDHSIAFWQSVATTFKNDQGVIFEPLQRAPVAELGLLEYRRRKLCLWLPYCRHGRDAAGGQKRRRYGTGPPGCGRRTALVQRPYGLAGEPARRPGQSVNRGHSHL